MAFELTILGSSSATPAENRHPSAQLLNVNGRYFLLDCGEATQIQLKKYHLKLSHIDHIFISHLHGDHYLGLPGLLQTMHLFGRKTPLHVYAPEPLRELIEMHLKVGDTKLSYPYYFHPVLTESHSLLFENNAISVHSIPMNHRIPCCGFLFRGKNKDHSISYAYCSDTRYDESIIPIVSKVDVLYHESTYLEEKAGSAHDKFHATAKEAAMVAQKAAVGKLLIGHFSARYKELQPFLEEAIPVFPNTELAEEGKVFSIDHK